MKLEKKLLFVLTVLVVLIGIYMFFQHAHNRDTLYQVSLLNGLMKGDYDGRVHLGAVGLQGDFGIGTYDRLDGEAIELDNVFYQVDAAGNVRKMRRTMTTPFFMTTFFEQGKEFA